MLTMHALTPETLERSLPFYDAFRRDIAVPYPELFREPGREHYLNTWRAILTMNMGAIFVLEDDGHDLGIILGTITPDLFDGALVATEHAWYVHPDAAGTGAGGKLLRVFEAWAAGRGAKKVVMSHFTHGMPDLELYFRKQGYRPLETHYLKAL